MKTSHQCVVLITILVFSVVGITGCAKKISIHPGSISSLDSYAFDILLVEQDAINQAKTTYLSGGLPPEAKAPLNVAIDQYNAAEAAWQNYHKTGAGQSTLQQALDALVIGVGTLQNILHKTPTPVSPTGLLIPMEVNHVNDSYRAA